MSANPTIPNAIDQAERIIRSAQFEAKARRLYAAANAPQVYSCPDCRFEDTSREHYDGHIRVTQHGEVAR